MKRTLARIWLGIWAFAYGAVTVMTIMGALAYMSGCNAVKGLARDAAETSDLVYYNFIQPRVDRARAQYRASKVPGGKQNTTIFENEF